MVKLILYTAGFAACMPLANYLISNVGTTCVPDGPCLIPVAPGLDAPSGVLAIGVALVLRDLVHRTGGLLWAFGAIALGAILSWMVADPYLVLASVVAFVVSELLDTGIYHPLQKNKLYLAVLASSLVGAIADSALFLFIAFGSVAFIEGQVVGKLWAAIIALPVIAFMRYRARCFQRLSP